jgi:hypothetical protein
MIDAKALFEDLEDDEYIKFERIESPLHPRPDICAFLLLHTLCPGHRSMVTGVDHDIIWLETDIDELNDAASEEDIVTLLRCGVHYDTEYDCLALFV